MKRNPTPKRALALAALLCLSSLSCQKKYCWKCAAFQYRGYTPKDPSVPFHKPTEQWDTTRYEVCDKTAVEIKDETNQSVNTNKLEGQYFVHYTLKKECGR
ncbi:hypothetical protein [Mucilaginibacter ginsenosidivorax]|uniref:hypothetical protein n=1 Tax=Mucilaginibacter ginsenosidivorax TaxID=862126 RepID=UPI0013158475|nr:hypothetical protein [Mucilaginibacter ginsenosidivorax]